MIDGLPPETQRGQLCALLAELSQAGGDLVG